MAEPFIGQIILTPYNFAPRNYAFCNGQLLSIAQNTALFSLLGTTYGGNGTTTFALPNLQGRVPMHFGQGPGLSNRSLGEQSGSESVTLTVNQIPAHNHVLKGSTTDGSTDSPTNQVLAKAVDPNTLNGVNSYAASANTNLNAASIDIAGLGQAHNNLQPYLCLNFVIALQGIFPSRN